MQPQNRGQGRHTFELIVDDGLPGKPIRVTVVGVSEAEIDEVAVGFGPEAIVGRWGEAENELGSAKIRRPPKVQGPTATRH